MNRIIGFALLAALLGLPACGVPEPPSGPTLLAFDIGFQINTHGYVEGEFGSYTALLLHSREDLDVYYNGDMDGNKNAYLSALEKYNGAFFQDKALLLITRAEGSGSISLQVLDVSLRAEMDRLEVRVLRNLPEMGTGDMARWVIGLELDKNAIPEGLSPHGSFPVTVEFIDN